MTDEQLKALAQYDEAKRNVQKQLVSKGGNRAEVEYGEAYQRLVALGLAPQIKSGYRIPKRFVVNS